MSANESMAELPKLKRKDLERLEAQLHQLLNRPRAGEGRRGKAIGQVMLEFAGRAEGLPEDYSANLDHYLYGVPAGNCKLTIVNLQLSIGGSRRSG